MSDSASLFSTTSTLFESPYTALNFHSSQAGNAPNTVPIEECWAVLVVNHDRFKADTKLLSSVGLPSTYERASQPGSSRSGLGKLDLRKRLQVQIPFTHLQSASVDRIPVPTTIEQLLANRPEFKYGRRQSLMELMVEDLVGIRIRRIDAAAVKLLFNGNDVRDATIFFPAHVLLRTPNWAVQKKLIGGGGQSQTFASAQVKWATCIFTSPVVPGSADDNDDKAYRAQREKEILSKLSVGETDDVILARSKPPSERNEALLDKLLLFLERRGVVWCKVGHLAKPSMLNSDPVLRPQFAVQGMFPEPFLDRCKAYCKGAGISLNGKNMMKPEAEETAKSSRAPLIIAAAKDHVSASDIARTKGNVEIAGQDEDLIQNWHVKVTLEPYMIGTPLAVGGAAAGIGMGMAGGF
ncbi:uncharacterized protein FA14DRAFT_162633 [Meira miltonrushii]|uniref:Uncharacterized protein n=1 Tax=Meira miltonrushii TaxID=1280837 RepID=A0A316V2D4_9BASI|nr:uncharacterized protein FA14DRAFT_162633 [Meira miltonrushii]PWN31717.1 hypothetical protein FA14DRAFT_162633 [Meira miltonrushii]